MRPFTWNEARSLDDAAKSVGNATLLAGGTTLLDLMKLDVMQPQALLDISKAPGTIESSDAGLRIGANVRMAEAAADPAILASYPVLAQSLQLAASAQIRNMATLGGNVLQRTRCPYFRDTSYPACNKRAPGSGCSALDGFNRMHAVLGASDACIAAYPGDFAQALMVLDASIAINGSNGPRTLSFADLHRDVKENPDRETTLAAGDVIVAFNIPKADWAKRSLYLKVRDRDSYAFALASAAVALKIENGVVGEARIALGGVATRPWRAHAAEKMLVGRRLDEATAEMIASAAFEGAKAARHNGFKIDLGRRTVARALLQAARLEV